ncbi:unnamed protein product [Rhodiola kirilowii]
MDLSLGGFRSRKWLGQKRLPLLAVTEGEYGGAFSGGVIIGGGAAESDVGGVIGTLILWSGIAARVQFRSLRFDTSRWSIFGLSACGGWGDERERSRCCSEEEKKVFGSRSGSIRKLMLEAEAPPLHHWSSSRTKAGKQFRLVNKQREQIDGVDDQRQNTSDRKNSAISVKCPSLALALALATDTGSIQAQLKTENGHKPYIFRPGEPEPEHVKKQEHENEKEGHGGGDLLKFDLGQWLSDVEEHKSIAIYPPHEGGYEGRYLNRLRYQGYHFLDLSARGLGDPETTLTKIHTPHVGKQPIARWYYPPEVDYRLSLLPPGSKGLVVWILEAKVLSKAELQFLALLPDLRPNVRVIAECGNWRKFVWKPLKEISGLTAEGPAN